MRPLIIVTFLLIAWLLTPLGYFSGIFLKSESLRLAYTVLYFFSLLASLFLFRKKIIRASWLQSLLAATFTGYLISIISLLIAELLMPGGFTLLAKTFRTTNLSTVLAVELFFPFMLLGWLFAPFAVFALKIGSRNR
ncbi:MAG: hypothetical protein H7336_15090 [Bacteriovorax sp.]|nr:hypothetical protein [Bacteriovorax sp.]